MVFLSVQENWGVCKGGVSRVSGVAKDSRFEASFSIGKNVGGAVDGIGRGITGALPSQTIELGNYTDSHLGSWPFSVS